jgi:hypothetical protein
MKNVFTCSVILAVLVFSFSACLKNGVKPQSSPATSLEGDWALVNDSTTITPWGLWQGEPVSGINYVGTSADYFHFTDNMVYYFDNGFKDTATYSLKKNYLYLGYTTQYGKDTVVYQVSNFTSHTVTLSGDTATDPEQVFTHIINLRR